MHRSIFSIMHASFNLHIEKHLRTQKDIKAMEISLWYVERYANYTLTTTLHDHRFTVLANYCFPSPFSESPLHLLFLHSSFYSAFSSCFSSPPSPSLLTLLSPLHPLFIFSISRSFSSVLFLPRSLSQPLRKRKGREFDFDQRRWFQVDWILQLNFDYSILPRRRKFLWIDENYKDEKESEKLHVGLFGVRRLRSNGCVGMLYLN